jgi:lipopolysaccharide transport system ATP-binding protein
MSDVVIKVEAVSKQYRLGKIGTGSLRHDLNRWWHTIRGKEDPYLKIGEVNDRTIKGASEYVWALRDINFEVKRGEVLGIIGRNGAGKSTLLKILSRTTLPTTGQIKTRGRIASLLEVGTGFHPELTGRENIFLNGAILGMRKAEIQRKLDEIIDFSGVERYIDTPVKRYSSGMYVRLAFAVAAHLDSEILIVDEVLAVGDAEFQNKCLGKMGEVSKGEGRTVLFVSHNFSVIETLCPNSIWIEEGSIKNIGQSKTIKKIYLQASLANCHDLLYRKDREGLGNFKLETVFVESPEFILVGSDLKIAARYGQIHKKNSPLKITYFGLSIWNSNDLRIISLTSQMKGHLYLQTIPLSGEINCVIKNLSLIPGIYKLNFFIASEKGIEDYLTEILEFEVLESDYFDNGSKVDPLWGVIVADHEWSLKP